MKLLSIQVGKVQTYRYNNEPWTTGYRKQAVQGAVEVGTLNVAGDEQHHTHVHGGPYRAILMYAAEHYQRWADELGKDLPFGSFAENFTVSGLDEDTVCIGDIYQIGDTVRAQVAQPRQPCNQIYQALGIRGIVKKINMSYRSGWYLRVLQTGTVEAGMTITRLSQPYPQWTIARAHQVMNNRKDDPEAALELSAIEELEPGWRAKLAKAAQQS